MSTRAIPQGLLHRIHADVACHGARDRETGMFLLASRGAPTITTLALVGTVGVTRRRGHFAVSGKALARLFAHARTNDVVVLAQIHSHGGAAFLSEVDLRHGFAVEGFTTSVIPDYRRPPIDPAAWGWWQHDGHGWKSTAPYTAIPGDGHTITFDEATLHAS
ncbi:MAG TPA: hypothetical protein VL988_00850 [Solirubrobacteraceae bacterium]|nr:hypothetical protein [Solirubrobacteraceae bacterium]